MSDSLDRYFAAEALDYIDRLDRALRSPDGPEAEVMLRLARGVSGSAQMAGAASVAAISQRLEEEFLAVHTGERHWSQALRSLVDDAVRELRQLVNDPTRWNASQGEVAQSTPSVVEIASLFHDDGGPHVLSLGRGASEEKGASAEPVPIQTLLLEPAGALREALALRAEVEQRLRSTAGAEEALGPAVRELFELLEVAAGGPAAG